MSEAPVRVRAVVVAYGRTERLPAALAGLESALAGVDGEVVVVLSPDDPAAAMVRARGHEVRSPAAGESHTPGANRNLGAAGTDAPYLFFVDGDMEVEPGFVEAALARLEGNPAEGGCGGRIHERQWTAQGLVREIPDSYRTGAGGDYRMLANAWVARRSAFDAVRGFDPRLPSEEDVELGERMLAAGWRLWCLDQRAAFHDCPPRPTLAELGRRWRTGLFTGQGLVLRYSWGTPLFRRHLWRQRLYLGALGFALAGGVFAALVLAGSVGARALLGAWGALAVLAILAMSWRKRDLRLGVLSLLTWLVLGAGIARAWLTGPPRRAAE